VKRVLVLGAGLVVRPPVGYLLDRGHHVTVASRTRSKALALTGDHPNTAAIACGVEQANDIAALVREHDLTVSLLPAPLHPIVARVCIDAIKPMVTTSYVSPAMRELDAAARGAGVVVLNELGLDPGIDHMSAMAVIADVKANGGKVVGFTSYCGGLPAPEANDNPFGYKFSWSPRGVLVAAKASARYLWDGATIETPGPELFTDFRPIEVDGAGQFEGYPNRDSLAYRETYGLHDATTILRGTLRNLGHCASWKKFADVGLLDETPRNDLDGLSYAGFMRGLFRQASGDLRAQAASAWGASPNAPPIERLAWLGMFDEQPISLKKGSNLDVLAARMWERMQYAPGERDMIALKHSFDVVYEAPTARKERIMSTLVDFGEPKGDSAMSRTVSLPAAIAVQMVLDRRWTEPGVHSPVVPGLYTPILAELADLGVKFAESRTPM